jgi:RNA polymerase sigma-70 factor (sigma-E family)
VDRDVDERFRVFVAERSAALFRTAYLLTGQRQAAEDLMQSALTKTVARLDGLRDPDAVEGYVRRAMYHEQVSRWRRPRAAEVFTDRPPDRPEQGHAEAADLRLVVRSALARLTPRQRAILVLRYFEDLSETEVAEALGISVGAVRSQTHRSLRRLLKVAPELRAMRELT